MGIRNLGDRSVLEASVAGTIEEAGKVLGDDEPSSTNCFRLDIFLRTFAGMTE